ncbi:MAG: adenylosuccinate lyase [Bdellovibrionales bacterium]|nr:adenylosuccinate lyase [Bdellovibrionales bacterium]
MLERYTRKEMGCVWTQENKFRKMLEVEKAVAQCQGEIKLIPSDVAQIIQKKAHFQIENILKNEKKTRHDVTAFVQEVATQVGEPAGAYVHFGLTSSDVLDSALALLIREASSVLKKSFGCLKKTLWEQAKKYKEALCCGRTHGRLAEPITFGLKLAGFLMELERNEQRFFRAVQQALVGKLSGAVGAYGTLPPELEQKVCTVLGLSAEPVATQVVPRDRHAEVILSLALTASGLERLAVEIRHLQRSEVGEVSEGFAPGQMGSSAMPHKKNPIYSENVTGLSRLLRSYVSSALENIVLWHERDISHSSVEREIFPSAFILCDFALNRMVEVIQDLHVDEKRMLENLQSGGGVVFSSLLLTCLVQKGMPRSSAYKLIQSISFNLRRGESLQDRLLENTDILKYLSPDEIKQKFSLEKRKKQISLQVTEVLKRVQVQ